MNTVSIQQEVAWYLAAPNEACRATVIIPAKDESDSLTATLDALRLQRTCNGESLPHTNYEVLVLLNNCTDDSLELVRRYAEHYESFRLYPLECQLSDEHAHVGMARKILLDLACDRLETLAHGPARVMLSTDADTVVALDWIAGNLAEIDAGAEVVGGVIHLFTNDLKQLDSDVRLAYERDRELQRLVAKLESLLDPDPADPWPRHLEHFGASLACTTTVYRRSGGIPPVKALEDVAFIDALRKVGAKIRHATTVQVATSARLNGRTEVGLSGQLRLWQEEAKRNLPQMVDSAEWLCHRFSFLAKLRQLNVGGSDLDLKMIPAEWQGTVQTLISKTLSTPRFLELLDCDRLIEETFISSGHRPPPRHAEITVTIAHLRDRITRLEADNG